MPFTGSHPAAVLPLLRTGLPTSALLIGSLAPDLPYYVPLADAEATHTPLGVATIDVLLGAGAWALWHALLSPPALAVAPAPVRGRLAGRAHAGLRRRLRSPGQIATTGLALAVGAATHLAWDEFTHAGRWGPRRVPALARTWGPLPGYEWMQHLSSAAGAAALAGRLRRWWRTTPSRPAPVVPETCWVWPLLGAAGLTAGVRAVLRGGSATTVAVDAATDGPAAVLFTAIPLAIAWYARAAARRG